MKQGLHITCSSPPYQVCLVKRRPIKCLNPLIVRITPRPMVLGRMPVLFPLGKCLKKVRQLQNMGSSSIKNWRHYNKNAKLRINHFYKICSKHNAKNLFHYFQHTIKIIMVGKTSPSPEKHSATLVSMLMLAPTLGLLWLLFSKFEGKILQPPESHKNLFSFLKATFNSKCMASLGKKILALRIQLILPISYPILQITLKTHSKMVLRTHMCGNLVVLKQISLMIILIGNLHLEGKNQVKNLIKSTKINPTQFYSLAKPLTLQCYHPKCSNSPHQD